MTIKIEEMLSSEDVAKIEKGLSSYNHEQVGESQYKKLNVVMREPNGKILGAVRGETYWGWMFIETLWVDESVRGKGYGTKLMNIAEDEARQRGCSNSYLDTFSFQAKPFYEARGYVVVGEIPEFPAGHSRYFLAKKL